MDTGREHASPNTQDGLASVRTFPKNDIITWSRFQKSSVTSGIGVQPPTQAAEVTAAFKRVFAYLDTRARERDLFKPTAIKQSS